ncbi:MAG: hypothetical protein WD044_06810 [Dongiaceae bacterium]
MSAIAFQRAALEDKTQAAGLVISRDPFIAWGPNGPHWRIGPGSALAHHIGNRRAYFLFNVSYSRHSPGMVDDDAAAIAALRRDYPEHRHIMLCNTRQELGLARERDIDAILCSTLAFVNETVFRIQPTETVRFDAIYTATLTELKRHELCRDVPNLALIYHWFHNEGQRSAAILEQYRAMLPQATFVNDLGPDYRLLRGPDVATWINRSRVGLCLSDVEGAMCASIEYLLCGRPVITTPSIGGRDRVLDPAWSITVEPTPDSVAAGVRSLIDRRLDPQQVRKSAAAALRPDRMRLLQLIAAIHEQEGVTFPERAPWLQLFRKSPWPQKTIGKMLSETPIADLLAIR